MLHAGNWKTGTGHLHICFSWTLTLNTLTTEKDFQKQNLSCVSVTTSFGVNNFRKTKVVRFIIFFQNVQNLFQILKMQQKSSKMYLVFQLIAFELVKINPTYQDKNSPSAVNVLTSSPKISDLTKNDFCKLNLAENDENVGQKSFSAGFSSFQDLLAR